MQEIVYSNTYLRYYLQTYDFCRYDNDVIQSDYTTRLYFNVSLKQNNYDFREAIFDLINQLNLHPFTSIVLLMHIWNFTKMVTEVSKYSIHISSDYEYNTSTSSVEERPFLNLRIA